MKNTKLSSSFIKATDELNTFEHHVPAPYFRKSFDLPFAPAEAEITVTGLGFYELYVNGREITKCPMAPYVSNADELVYYDTYDLLPYLKKGENVIGLLLGNGLRNGIGGFVWDFDKTSARGPLCLALDFDARDGEKIVHFEADESFLTHPSPVLFDDERLGYIYDSNQEIPGWCEPGFDVKGWENAKKCLLPRGEKAICNADPLKIHQRIKPVKIEHFDSLPFLYHDNLAGAKPVETSYRKDVYVYDFGVISSGLTELHIHGKKGQKVTVRHGEWLQDGKFSITTTVFNGPQRLPLYEEYGQKDEFILKGGEETLLPKFKYDGFRYAFVEGLTSEQATEDALTFVEFHSDVAKRGWFSSSDESLNKLFECADRSDRSNFVWFPTDCPHREKNGWTGDAAMSADHMMLHLKAGKSLKEWMHSARNVQRTDGALPGIIPTGGWGYAWGNGPAWDSVSVSVPYAVYQYEGDREIVEENIAMIVRYMNYVMTRRDELGLIHIGLGDWVDPDWSTPVGSTEQGRIKTPLEVTDSIMTYESAKHAAHLCRQIGRKNEAAYLEMIAADMRDAVRKHLVDFDTMTVKGDCQTAQCFAIDAGIFNEDELPKAQAKMLEIIHRDGDTNRCGMIGLRHLFRVLDAMGENDLAYRIIVSKNRSSYGAWLEAGATCLFENFPYPDGTDCASHDHHFLGDIVAWMMNAVAGVRPNPTVTDASSFAITPTFLEDLTYAQAYFDAKEGRLSSAWQKENGKVTLTVKVPEGMHGTLKLPKNYKSISAVPETLLGGEYVVQCVKM